MSLKTPMRLTLALAIAVVGLAARPATLSAQVHGDVNGDGIVSALDAQAILTHVVGLSLPAGFNPSSGDANCDATTGALDAQIVLSSVIGLNVSQYCVGQHFGPTAVAVTVTPADTSLLINRGIWLRATLKDSLGFAILRPISWTTSNPAVVTLDTMRNDSAFVKATGNAGSVTITAMSDGSSKQAPIKVFSSYAGVVIVPQRGDTIRQIFSTRTFTVKTRDSLGNVTNLASSQVTWSMRDTAIADVNSSGVVTAKSTGTTLLRIVSNSNPTVKDSVPVVVALPALTSCTGSGGTVHNAATYTTAQTWSAATNPHYVNGTQTFNNGGRLVVEQGALVCMGSGVTFNFNAGARMIARGTVAQPIVFKPTVPTNFWNGIQFGVITSYGVGNPADTSVITNAVFERASSSGLGLSGREQHTLILDSIIARQFNSVGVRINGPGSRLSRSVVDSAGFGNSAFSVTVGRGTLEFTTIRCGPTCSGIAPFEAGSIHDVNIIGPQIGIGQGSASGIRVNNLAITGSTGFAIDLQNMVVDTSSSNVTITGGTGGAFRGLLPNLAILFPDSLKQQTLKGNGQGDTLFVTGGTVRGLTFTARPDLPWLISSEITIDSAARFNPRPGSRFAFAGGSIRVLSGGRMTARGEPGKRIIFKRRGTSGFGGFFFGDPLAAAPAIDTSYLVNVVVDSAGSYCYDTCAAVVTSRRHALVIDSSVVRQSLSGAVSLGAPTSRISRSSIDTTGTPTSSYPALYLYQNTLAETTTVRRSGNVGVAVNDGVALRALSVLNSNGVGLDASNASLAASAGVVLSGNTYPFRGRIETLALFARDSVRQLNLLGNTDNVVVITGGTLQNDTITAIPQLRWQVENQVTFDTLAQFAPRPDARITFSYGGLIFSRGGVLRAIGEAAKPIRFYPNASTAFYGLLFNDPGAGSNPFLLAPVATSTLINVRVDSASGQCCNRFGYAAINAGDRHRLIIDSARVRLSHNGAVFLGARGSTLSRSIIDTTGTPTTSYAAVALWDSTTMQQTVVRRSGNIGVYASGTGARLTNDTIVNSVSYGLYAGEGVVAGDSGSVVMRGNAYVGRMSIQNLAVLAPDSISQRNWYDNTTADSAVVISTGTLRGNVATSTTKVVRAIPQLRWQVEQNVAFDTLTVLRPSPGARFDFYGGGFVFQAGGTLDAQGTAANPIRFRPLNSSNYFYGLLFNDPGPGSNPFFSAPVAQSTLINVRVDSASGQCCNRFGYAAINAGDRHRLLIDSAHVRLSHNGAVYLAARGSRLSRSIIDTTGTPTTSYAAVALWDSTTMEQTVVRRSGNHGVYASGTKVRLVNDTILNGVGYGLYAGDGILAGDSGSVVMRGNQYIARMRIENLGILAPDSASQRKWYDNTTLDSVIVITGGTLRGNVATSTVKTVRAIPQVRWQVETNLAFDTLSVLRPHPGARFDFYGGGFIFQAGGTLDAHGTAAQPIRFRPLNNSNYFYGLLFNSPGAGPNPPPPQSQVMAQSTLINVRVDSASGQCCNTFGVAAINGADRHRLTIDSSVIRFSHQGAVHLAAPGSNLLRSRIDTTFVASNGYPAVALGDSTWMEATKVEHSGAVGVFAAGNKARLRNVQIVNSGNYGLMAENGILRRDTASITITGTQAPARLRIENVGQLIRDSVAQAKWTTYTDTAIVVVSGGTLTSDTIVATRAVQWLMISAPRVGANSRLHIHPGTRVSFWDTDLGFINGGTLNAIGTVTDSVHFVPYRFAAVNFRGLYFENPSSGFTTSYLQYVRLDSATGTCGGGWGCSAAINTGTQHRVIMSNSQVHKAFEGAIWLQSAQSSLTDVLVDTSGSGPSFVTNQIPVWLNDSTSATNLTIIRSGNRGIAFDGQAIVVNNLNVSYSRLDGIWIQNNNFTNGSAGMGMSSFSSTNNGGAGVLVSVTGAQFAYCQVSNNGTNGIETTFATAGTNIHNCDILDNANLGIKNFDQATTPNGNVINASNNYWGGGSPSVGGPNGVSNNVNVGSVCSFSCKLPSAAPMGGGLPPAPAIPTQEVALQSERRRRLRKRGESN